MAPKKTKSKTKTASKDKATTKPVSTAPAMPEETAVAVKPDAQTTPYQLSKEQTLKASKALLQHVAAQKSESSKPNLLEDEEDPTSSAVAIWLVMTTRKFITDTKKLKPMQIVLPHALCNPERATVCLIVKDPQRAYKDLVEVAGLTNTVTKVVGVGKLMKKFKSYEQKRLLAESHDIFLADDRVVPKLPAILGKSFYAKTSKRPIPVDISRVDSPGQIKNEIKKALSSTFVHLAPSASTNIRVGLSSLTPEQLTENVSQVVDFLTEKTVPRKWRGVRSFHIKSPESASLPIWMTPDLYEEEDVLNPEEEKKKALELAKKANERKERNGEKKKKLAGKKKERMDRLKAIENPEAAEAMEVDGSAKKRKPEAQAPAASEGDAAQSKKKKRKVAEKDGGEDGQERAAKRKTRSQKA